MDNSNWQYEYEVEHFRLEKAQAEIKELRDALNKIVDDCSDDLGGRAISFIEEALKEGE